MKSSSSTSNTVPNLGVKNIVAMATQVMVAASMAVPPPQGPDFRPFAQPSSDQPNDLRFKGKINANTAGTKTQSSSGTNKPQKPKT